MTGDRTKALVRGRFYMKRLMCALLTAVLLIIGAVAVAEDDYYDKAVRPEVDNAVAMINAEFDPSGEYSLFDQNQETEMGIGFASSTTSLTMIAMPTEDWQQAAAYVIMASDVDDYGLAMQAAYALSGFYDFDDNSKYEMEGWLDGNWDDVMDCGANDKQMSWGPLETAALKAEMSVTPLPDYTRLNIILYITDDYSIDIYMGEN